MASNVVDFRSRQFERDVASLATFAAAPWMASGMLMLMLPWMPAALGVAAWQQISYGWQTPIWR